VKRYKAEKSRGIFYILSLTLMYDLLMLVLLHYINSYEISIILKTIMVSFNFYQLYYILLNVSLNYIFDDNKIIIKGVYGLRRVCLPLSDVKAYSRTSGTIRGVQLYGYGKGNFAFGKSIIEKIGVASMYVTSSNNIIYIKTENMVYGISPVNYDDFEQSLIKNGIENRIWEHKLNRSTNLYKDKRFIIPFLAASIIIFVVTLNPLILYLTSKLPSKMPLIFDASFKAVKFGTGKQFAFKQMVYGVLNMALLFCMYYASYFYARYDRKMSYRFIYISMFIAGVFLVMQFRIIYLF
jgi:hypothetical protein